MPRDGVDSTAQAALTSQLVRMAFLVDLQFADQTLYVWTGVGPLAWNGNTYQGVGVFGEISAIGEGSSVEAQGVQLKLSGIDPTLLAESMNEISRKGKAWIRLPLFDQNGSILSVIPLYMGLIDRPEIGIDPGSPEKPDDGACTITIEVENRLADMNRARGGRYTDQDQRSRYPQDGSLRWVSYNQDHEIIWKTG